MATDPRYEAGRAAIAALPPSVRICGYDFVIEKWCAVAAEACDRWGEFSAVEQIIRVRENMATQTKAANTFVHEVNHAIFWCYGVGKDDGEERIVTTLANAWTAIYRDNPWLLSWLAECLR